MSNSIENQEKPVKEIDLVEVVKVIWHHRKTIYLYVGIFIIIGLVFAFTQPKVYRAEVTLAIESRNTAGGLSSLIRQFGGLAGLSGVNTRLDQDAITPGIYPKVIASTPFLLELMRQEIYLEKKGIKVNLVEYFSEHNKKSLLQLPTAGFSYLVKRINNKEDEEDIIQTDYTGSIRMTKKQERVAKTLKKKIKSSFEKDDNTLKISFEIQEKEAIAPLTDTIVNMLTRYIVDYRTSKVKDELVFIENMKVETYANYLKAQEKYALFVDRNKNTVSELVKSEEKRLEEEYQLAENIYNTVAMQREQALIKLNEHTPVFKVLNPSVVPNKKAKPKRSIMLIAFIMLGFLVGVGKIFYDVNVKPLQIKNTKLEI